MASKERTQETVSKQRHNFGTVVCFWRTSSTKTPIYAASVRPAARPCHKTKSIVSDFASHMLDVKLCSRCGNIAVRRHVMSMKCSQIDRMLDLRFEVLVHWNLMTCHGSHENESNGNPVAKSCDGKLRRARKIA